MTRVAGEAFRAFAVMPSDRVFWIGWRWPAHEINQRGCFFVPRFVAILSFIAFSIARRIRLRGVPRMCLLGCVVVMQGQRLSRAGGPPITGQRQRAAHRSITA
jgi:hypothetical protein